VTDPWEKAYVYGRYEGWGYCSRVAHVIQVYRALCGEAINQHSQTPNPYPICRNCLRTKRAKELGLA
jgi:hypothetical protein